MVSSTSLLLEVLLLHAVAVLDLAHMVFPVVYPRQEPEVLADVETPVRAVCHVLVLRPRRVMVS